MDPATSFTDTAPVARTRARERATRRLTLAGYGFLAPALVVLVIFLLAPAVWVFGLSLFKWDLIANNPVFVGLENFRILLTHDDLWWQSVRQTVYYTAVSVPVSMALGLFLAVLLNGRIRGRQLLRGAIFAPYVTPVVATIMIWQWILNADYGVLNSLLAAVHLPRPAWTLSPNWIMPSIIIYGVWQHTGLNLVIYLAGLASLPAELHEAARVDGARAWSTFWRISWPLLSPTTYFLLFINLIGSFKVFVPVYVFTTNTGGPDHAAETIGFYLYQQAFAFFHAGYAGAISVALFLLILVLTGVQMRFFSRRVFYT
ncbi:MAG TPA: sugar ABC transporter permease [Candidatus Dormibacteraeota bacterium]|nr:sugar ABC transporter permease [Candidatus Dormibacteraeota bacterium]